MYVELFEAGLGDAIVLDHTNAEAMQHRGTGFIANDYTVTGGLGPNSVYYCRTDRLEELSDRLVAVHLSTRRVDAADEVGERRRAPAAARRALADACRRRCWATPASGCCNSQTWDTARIDQTATERWMRILFEESMVRSVPAFGDVVDTTIVDAVESATVSV